MGYFPMVVVEVLFYISKKENLWIVETKERGIGRYWFGSSSTMLDKKTRSGL